MTCPGHFFMACRMSAPRHRPPARGGPTRDDRLWRGTSRLSLVGPPLAGGLRCRPVTGSRHTACHEKVTGTCHSERSEESEVGHASRLVEPDASLPLSMTREGAFFTACYEKSSSTCHARSSLLWC